MESCIDSGMPRIEISLAEIRSNAQFLSTLYGKQGISLMGVSKAVLGNPAIAAAMVQGGVGFIADSRVANIQRMREAGIVTRFVLLRTALSQAEAVVRFADISLNSELATIAQLSYHAGLQDRVHQVILMVEMGDLREGILPAQIIQFIQETIGLPHIQIIGIGCNLACYGGIKPTDQTMNQLSAITVAIEQKFQINLEIISGGNSANHDWYEATETIGRINNLRLGESILLGCETVNRLDIPGLYQGAFRLVAEVIEAKDKPSLPYGESCQTAFGEAVEVVDRGIHRRVIVALGRQDILVSGLTASHDLTILGASSDHVILDDDRSCLVVGDSVSFSLNYGGLLSAMTSPFVNQKFV
jgi:ornithine racemase